MILSTAIALLAQLPLSPILQPASNAYLNDAVANVVATMKAGDWPAAERAFRALPKREIVVEWDDAKVPAKVRPEYAEARDAFAKDFAKQSVDWTVKFAKPGAVKVTFVEKLGSGAGDLPKGAAMLFSIDPGEPQVELVMSLSRGNPATPTSADDVYNELGHAVMQYLGRTWSPAAADFSYRSDQPSVSRRRLAALDRLFMRRTMMSIESLGESLRKRQTLELSTPRLVMDTKEISWPPVVQGDVREFRLQVSNPGNAPLLIQARPDCGCVFVEPTTTIDPGQTGLIRGGIDTTEFVGDLDKRVFMTTNDAQKPFISIPVKIFAKPLYRLLQPTGNTVLADASGATTDVFLAIDPTVKMSATGVQTAGMDASARLEPWTGTLADPEMKEPAKSRKGYRIPIRVAKGVPPGRYGVTVSVMTDHPKYPVLRHSFYVQTGIVALPSLVYFGEIRQSPRRASFLVSRPGKPFKIQKLVSGTPFVKLSGEVGKSAAEHRVEVQMDGKQPVGPLNLTVQVFTDDPKQPRLDVPLSAQVR